MKFYSFLKKRNLYLLTLLLIGCFVFTVLPASASASVTGNATDTTETTPPSLSANTVTLAAYTSKKLDVVHASTNIKWKSSKSSVVSVKKNGTIFAKKKGSAVVTATVNGVKLSCVVKVSNPKLSSGYYTVVTGKTKAIKIKGTTTSSVISYKSSNKKVATISKTGLVTTKKSGVSTITVTVDGKKLNCIVTSTPKVAYGAVQKAKKIIDSSSYSQANRMSSGYYDCSSLVWRGYGSLASSLLGGSGWAPTAAGEAYYLEQDGKVISHKFVTKSKLLPGDLVFYGNRNNGRYLGIYHVSMYYGNGLMIEKPLRDYTFNKENIVMVARPTK